MKSIKPLTTFILTVSIILLIPSCAVNPVTGKKQLMFMSEAQEVSLGAQYDPSVVATFGIYKNEALLGLITKNGAEMGKISHRPHLQYHFKILDSPVINAFAVPGGYIYLTRGILAQFNNEAELMGVLAHEMGHITARHTAQQQTRQQIGQILLVGGMIASKEFANYVEYAMQGMQLLFLSFSRENEREADRLGVEYSSKIGYDAHKMADFFNVLKKMQLASSHAGVPTFMSTHPDPGDRYNAVHRTSDAWQDSLKQDNWTVNTDNYLQLIDGMVYGEDPRQGFVDGNAFYHPDLKFKFPFPQGWKLVNSPLQVQISPPDQKALLLFLMAREKTLDEAAQKALGELQLTVLDSKRTNVNGYNAIAAVSQQVSQDQQTGQQQITKVLSYFIEKEGHIYVFHGVSDDADFNNYFRVFEYTMGNFNNLTEPSRLNVRPNRIKVMSVQRSGNVADAFKTFGIPQSQFNELALLNNLELTDRVNRGKLLKVIGD
ncbi:MAG: M48 family metalloprotease [Bacteroidota bacterium]